MRTPIFSELITHYLTQYLSVQRNLSSNTIRSYRDTFKLLLSFCRDEKGIRIVKLTIAQLDKQCIEDFLLWLRDIHGVSESTYNQRLCAIRAFFAYVMIEEPSYMEHCKKILDIPSLKTPDREPQYMSADALKRVLSAPDTSTKRGRRHLTILTVLYDTAARVSELTNILIRDVRLDFPASITLHGKGGKIRTVPIMKETVALLKEYFSENHIDPKLHSSVPLFWNSRHEKLTRSGITYIVKKYADLAGAENIDLPAKISPHIFRHTKAMHLVQADVHPIYIKDYLGHSDITTTEIYARADNEMKRVALEKAAKQIELPKPSVWKADDALIELLSSLG